MTPREIYESKKVTWQEALSHIRSNDCLIGGTDPSEPVQIYSHLHTLIGRVTGLRVWSFNMQGDYPFMTDPRCIPHFVIHSVFYGAHERACHRYGQISHYPWYLSEIPRYVIETDRPTVFIAAVPPMDEDGYFSISPMLLWELEGFSAADIRIFEVNPKVPRMCGAPKVHVSEITCLIESDAPISQVPEIRMSPVERQIGAYAAELIRDGDTLQFGIGSTSNAVAESLCEKHDLGIHTEMFSTPMQHLMEHGVINNSRKNFHPGKAVCAFAWGDMPFYRFIHDNPQIELCPAAFVNNPVNIAQNDNMVSINTALQIDLTGQICSESLGSRQYSGTGGATDFASGAYRSRGGRGIIAVTSTAKGGTVSRIQPMLTPGSVVSIQRNVVDYIVTEYGGVNLVGCSTWQRAEGLISVAHPKFRDELIAAAEKQGIWVRSNKR